MYAVKFTADIKRAPASKSFATLLEARKYEMSYPNFAAQIYVNGVCFDGCDYTDLMDGDISESQMIERYIQDKQLTAEEIAKLRAAVAA